MNKKGVSHVDFVISLAIFLIYILGIFLYIKPNFGPVFSNERMVEVIRDNFEEEVYWVVKKVPLFVEKCKPDTGEETVVVIVEYNGGWGVYGDGIGDKNSFTFERGKPDKKEVHDLVFYPQDGSDLSLELEVRNGEKCKVAQLGAISDIKGIDKSKVDDLEEKKYENLKTNFGIPENDFRIKYNNIIIGEEPSVQADVYVREFNAFEVSKIGEINKVVVNIAIW